MRRLLLLRHAKSSWDDPSLDDIDRPLAKRGRKAAPKVGKELVVRGWLPESVVVSPAARTRQTWELVAAELSNVPKATFPKALYMASPTRILQQVRKTAKTTATLLLIGHNPALEEFAEQLAGDGSDAAARASMEEMFPTAALARFEFEGRWVNLGSGGARLTHFLRPKDMG